MKITHRQLKRLVESVIKEESFGKKEPFSTFKDKVASALEKIWPDFYIGEISDIQLKNHYDNGDDPSDVAHVIKDENYED